MVIAKRSVGSDQFLSISNITRDWSLRPRSDTVFGAIYHSSIRMVVPTIMYSAPLLLTFAPFYPHSIFPYISIQLALINSVDWWKYVACNQWLQWPPNCCEWFFCRIGLFDSFGFGQKQAVSGIFVTDAQRILKCLHFSMEKMTFTFRVTLKVVGIRRKTRVKISLQGRLLLQQIHQPLVY